MTIAGTLGTALSLFVAGETVMVGPAFYNYVLIPTGLVLLATTALAPLLRWGASPSAEARKWLVLIVCWLAATRCWPSAGGIRSSWASSGCRS